MQSRNATDKPGLSQKQKEQWRGYVTSKLEDAEKKEEAKILEDKERVDRWMEETSNDQENIKEIISKHPYKKWEDLTNNPLKDTANG
tara:strand:- start:139 stop:399 length:261 start_codon:yes stop_codon:yes gene_type:complete